MSDSTEERETPPTLISLGRPSMTVSPHTITLKPPVILK